MIELNNIVKIYNKGKENEFEALHDICIYIKDGEMVAIMGKSGAGKSTLLHILGCIDSYEQGEYCLDDVMIKGKKEKQLKAIWGYLSPRIEYLKDIPKNIFDKGISAISYTEEFKEEFDKNPKDTLKHIIDKLNSEFNSILHEYDFN